MSEITNPENGTSTAQIIFRRTADVGYIVGAILCAYLVYPMMFPAHHEAAREVSVQGIQFTTASASATVTPSDPAQNYREERLNLAEALLDMGVPLAETVDLRTSDQYFNLLAYAGPDFLRTQIETAKRGVLSFQEKEQSGKPLSAIDRATLRMERAKISYYDHLLTTQH